MNRELTRRAITPFIFLMVFSSFLVGQIFFDKLNTEANFPTRETRNAALYKNNLKNFKARTFNDLKVNLAENRAPVVILNFWASWCRPCLEEFPSLVKLRKRYREDQVFILGINGDDEKAEEKIHRTYSKHHLNFPSIVDKDGGWSEKFQVKNFPFTVIYIGDEAFSLEGGQDFMSKGLLRRIDKFLPQK